MTESSKLTQLRAIIEDPTNRVIELDDLNYRAELLALIDTAEAANDPHSLHPGDIMTADKKIMVFMEIAHDLSVLGTCDRKKVGALIVREGRCVSWGYNGAPPGQLHCDANEHGYENYPFAPGTTMSEAQDIMRRLGCRNATHAEANALAFAARQGISTEGATLFVTVSPCETCARLIIAAGIKEVIWDEEYRDRAGIELLERALGGGARALYDPRGSGDASRLAGDR